MQNMNKDNAEMFRNSYTRKVKTQQEYEEESRERRNAPQIPNGRFYSFMDVIDNFIRRGEMPPRKVQISFIESYTWKKMDPHWQLEFIREMKQQGIDLDYERYLP